MLLSHAKFQILYDYEIWFGFPDNLIDKFSRFKLKILKLLHVNDAECCTNMGYDSDTTSILMLFRALSMKKSFGLNVNTLIVYSDVSWSNILYMFAMHTMHAWSNYIRFTCSHRISMNVQIIWSTKRRHIRT